MKPKEFKEYIKRHGQGLRIKFLDDNTIENKYGWKSYDGYQNRVLFDIYKQKNYLLKRLRTLKYLTEYLDYKCDFDTAGDCRETRCKKSHWKGCYRGNKKCCCTLCASEAGYIRIWPVAKMEKFADLFDERDGFWEKDTGCKLDRKDRSEICLRYNCHPDKEFRNSLYALGNEIRKSEDKILDLQRKENLYIKHKNADTKAYNCDLCGEVTNLLNKVEMKKSGWKTIETVTGQKRTVCPCCQTKFKMPENA